MPMLVVPGEQDLTALVRESIASRYKVEDASDLGDALELCRQADVGLIVVIWPAPSLQAERLSRLLERPKRPCPILAVVPPDRLLERRMLSRHGVRYLPMPVDRQEILFVVEQLDDARGRTHAWLGDVCVDKNLRQVTRAGARVRLTRKEFDLLDHFQRNRGLVLSKEQLLSALWGSQVYNPNVVEVAVSGLRRKLERLGPRLIHTVHGVGYVCHPETDDAPQLEGLMERRRSLLADRQRLLVERDAILARARTLRTPDDDGA